MDQQDLRDLPVFDNDVIGTLSRFLDAGSIGTAGTTLVVDGMEARKVGVSPSAIQQIKINQESGTQRSSSDRAAGESRS